MGETIRLTGQTRLTRNEAEQLMHQTSIRISDGHVETLVSGFGEGCADHPPVVSDHPAVEQYAREVDRALQITAYQNRPIQTRFKPEKKRRRKSADHP